MGSLFFPFFIQVGSYTLILPKCVCRKMKKEFLELLLSTRRQGVDKVVDYLEKSGFFTAPASVSKHLSRDGGLLEHSLNVCKVALMLREQMIAFKPDIESNVPKESVILSALLHDVCKSSIYKKMQKFKKNAEGRWESYDGYDVDYSRFPFGHGEKSVVMLLRLGLELTNEELLAIRWHMAAWDLPFQSYEEKSNLSEASNVPLVSLVQAADGLAAHLLESE